MQGGLEIPIKVTVTMKNIPENKQAMTKYKEPVDRQFEDVTSQVAT